ncbi:hypothetical protein O1611_g7620 [Lasiodiplodia mahajangana]|uniref:Uncharacterized protein n=1 Tax=Lasiodiplodia mahajangana TaxID=1108764 RepID=A0ACC2JEU8_9PEZI|nr:hypothetical protein O1611_g7620 [Lasiodiplodia mahajangana]
MSGFEIAGVVLGAIPLVISALENYEAGKGIAASMIRWKGLLQDLIFKLKLQRRMFYLGILELARSAQVNELVDLADPTEEQCVNLLRNVNNTKQIKLYFGSLHGTFIDIVRRYETCLKAIAGKLEHVYRLYGTAKDDLAALIDANPARDGKFEFRKRVHFAIRRRSLSDLVDQLRDDRLSLEVVVRGVKTRQEWIVKQASIDAIRLAQGFSETRRTVASLYLAIQQGYTCNCPNHRIFLHLQNRTMRRYILATGFDLIFDVRGQLQDAIVEVSPSGVPNYAPSQSTQTTAVSSNLPTIQMPTQNASNWQDLTNSAIDLCFKANEASLYGTLLGLRLIGDELHIKTDTARQRKNYSAQKSLNEFLRDGCQDEDARMTPKQQTILALDIASSILQLCESFWCQSPLNSSAVQLFFHCSVKAQTHMSESFLEQVMERQAMKQAAFQGPRPREALLELAILLLEIWHHKTFEMWASKANISDLVSVDARMVAAMRWLRMTHQRLPPHHLTAVEQCLALSSGRPWRWGDDEFQRLFCENVVKPLAESCKAW